SVMPLIKLANAQRGVHADGLAGAAHLPVRRYHGDFAYRRQALFQRLQPQRLDSVVIGQKDLLHLQQSSRRKKYRGGVPIRSGFDLAPRIRTIILARMIYLGCVSRGGPRGLPMVRFTVVSVQGWRCCSPFPPRREGVAEWCWCALPHATKSCPQDDIKEIFSNLLAV